MAVHPKVQQPPAMLSYVTKSTNVNIMVHHMLLIQYYLKNYHPME